MKKIIAGVLAISLLLTLLAACGERPQLSDDLTNPTVESTDAPTEETKPSETTEPETTEPETTEPEATEPETTVPETTEPETTVPETTVPEPTVPETTVPEETDPPFDFKDGYSREELAKMDTEVNGYGQGIQVDENNRPYGALNAQKQYGDYSAYFIAPIDGNIYLTFDEGYENGYTPKILDVLKEKNVKAVFFVTMDYCKSSPELVQRMIDEGHAVGNHSVHHKSMPTLSIDTMVDEVMVLHDYVKEHFGYEMHLFRPPMGQYSQQSLAVLQNLGYKTVNWSFAYMDYDPENQPSYQKAYDRVVGAAHSGGIFLLHAISKTNTDILGDVIDAFREQGYNLELFS